MQVFDTSRLFPGRALAFITALMLVVCIRAQGAPLPVGGALFTPAEADPTGGVVVAGGVPQPFSTPAGPGQFSGTLTTTVISGDPSNPFIGGLTFVYLLHNDITSSTSIERMTHLDYTGFSTNVSYQAPTAGQIPTSTNRSIAPGSVVGWSFDQLGLGVLAPGATSALLVVQTNAPGYVENLANIIDGSIATAVTFGPSLDVPEPGSIPFLASVAFALLRRRRR